MNVQVEIDAIASLMDVQGCVTAGPSSGSFAALATAVLAKKRGVLFITAHQDDADEAVAMFYDLGISVELFPALESEIAKELVSARFAVLDGLANDSSPRVIVASIASLMQMTPVPVDVPSVVKRLRINDTHSLSGLQEWLVNAGYERKETIEESAQFASRGGVLDIATTSGEFVRLDFFGDTIETINEVDPVSLGSDLIIDEVVLASAKRVPVGGTLVDHLPQSWTAVGVVVSTKSPSATRWSARPSSPTMNTSSSPP